MDLVRVPPWTEEQIFEYFNATITDALSHGLTGLHDAALSPALAAIVERYNFVLTTLLSIFDQPLRLADENKLPVRS